MPEPHKTHPKKNKEGSFIGRNESVHRSHTREGRGTENNVLHVGPRYRS